MNDARFSRDRDYTPPPPPTGEDEPHNRGAPPIGDEIRAPELEIFDAGDEDGNIPPREWLLGAIWCRCFLSGLVSAGAGGKTTLRILQALSLACGRSLTGEHVFMRCRVMIICLEDDMKELRRRVLAARLRHGVTAAEVKGFLILTTPRGLKIAERDGKGTVVAGGLYRALIRAIDDWKLDLVCIDPAIKAHSLKENDNGEIDAFASLLANLSAEKNIAIDLLSHERKASGADAGDINRSRGAGSQKDAQRLAYTLTGMSETEAEALGISNEERAFLIRIDGPPNSTSSRQRDRRRGSASSTSTSATGTPPIRMVTTCKPSRCGSLHRCSTNSTAQVSELRAAQAQHRHEQWATLLTGGGCEGARGVACGA